MAFQALEGKWSFHKVLGLFVDFLSGWKFWRERTRALVKIGKFSGIFGEFLEYLMWLGPIRNYFSKTEVLLQYSQCARTAG
jgi:hypothetical protein